MTEINRLAPAFENLAYSQQMMENQDALKQAAMLADLSNTEYARYRDLVGDAQNYRKYALNDYRYEGDVEEQKNKLANSLDTANKSYEQKLYLDRIQEAEAAQAAARAASSRGGGGGWGGYGGGDYGQYGSGYDLEGNVANQEINIMQGGQPVRYLIVSGTPRTADEVKAGLANGTFVFEGNTIVQAGASNSNSYNAYNAGIANGVKHGGAGFSWSTPTATTTTNLGDYNRSAQERQKNSKRNQ